MRVAGVAGRTVSITVRFADFTTITRSRTIPEATDVTQEIYRAAVRLYDALGLQRARLRLVGVRVEGLVPRSAVHRQGVLGERERGWPDADRAVDRATRRFGTAAVRPASLLDREERHPGRLADLSGLNLRNTASKARDPCLHLALSTRCAPARPDHCGGIGATLRRGVATARADGARPRRGGPQVRLHPARHLAAPLGPPPRDRRRRRLRARHRDAHGRRDERRPPHRVRDRHRRLRGHARLGHGGADRDPRPAARHPGRPSLGDAPLARLHRHRRRPQPGPPPPPRLAPAAPPAPSWSGSKSGGVAAANRAACSSARSCSFARGPGPSSRSSHLTVTASVSRPRRAAYPKVSGLIPTPRSAGRPRLGPRAASAARLGRAGYPHVVDAPAPGHGRLLRGDLARTAYVDPAHEHRPRPPDRDPAGAPVGAAVQRLHTGLHLGPPGAGLAAVGAGVAQPLQRVDDPVEREDGVRVGLRAAPGAIGGELVPAAHRTAAPAPRGSARGSGAGARAAAGRARCRAAPPTPPRGRGARAARAAAGAGCAGRARRATTSRTRTMPPTTQTHGNPPSAAWSSFWSWVAPSGWASRGVARRHRVLGAGARRRGHARRRRR